MSDVITVWLVITLGHLFGASLFVPDVNYAGVGYVSFLNLIALTSYHLYLKYVKE